MKLYHVYLMTNRHRSAIYTGVTGSLEHRVHQHKTKAQEGFTSRYHVDRLVYYEETNDIGAAIAREKQIKSWTRPKKVALIESVNPIGWISPRRGSPRNYRATPPHHLRIPSPKSAVPASRRHPAQNDNTRMR